MLVFEDVHQADEATLELLRYVSRRIHRVAALVVLTWRAELVGPDHPLYRLLGELPADATERLDQAALARGGDGAGRAGRIPRACSR